MAKKVKKIKRLTDQMRGKLILVFIGIICLFFILAVRLTYWTVNKGSEFETKVLGQQKHDSSVIPFERGKIYDRNGNILATNEKIYTLVLEPRIFCFGRRNMKRQQLTLYMNTLDLVKRT